MAKKASKKSATKRPAWTEERKAKLRATIAKRQAAAKLGTATNGTNGNGTNGNGHAEPVKQRRTRRARTVVGDTPVLSSAKRERTLVSLKNLVSDGVLDAGEAWRIAQKAI